MRSPVVPEIRRLTSPSCSGVVAVMEAGDAVYVKLERLEHENAALREENDGLRCRVEELEAEAMEAAGNYRRPIAYSIVEGLGS